MPASRDWPLYKPPASMTLERVLNALAIKQQLERDRPTGHVDALRRSLVAGFLHKYRDRTPSPLKMFDRFPWSEA